MNTQDIDHRWQQLRRHIDEARARIAVAEPRDAPSLRHEIANVVHTAAGLLELELSLRLRCRERSGER